MLQDDIDLDFEKVDLTDPEKRERYGNIAGLKGTKSWTSLIASLDEKERLQVKSMTMQLLGGIQNPETLISYTKGFLAGLRWAKSAPSNAQRVYTKLSSKEG